MTACTTSSGALAPAVTPTMRAPARAASSSSSTPLMRCTVGHPTFLATFSRASVFDELALPMTSTASARLAMAVSAAWRLVVAKQRSSRVAVHSSGYFARARSTTPFQSSRARVVWARTATLVGSSMEAASTSCSCSTSRIAAGASASVPIASSWPAWPT